MYIYKNQARRKIRMKERFGGPELRFHKVQENNKNQKRVKEEENRERQSEEEVKMINATEIKKKGLNKKNECSWINIS